MSGLAQLFVLPLFFSYSVRFSTVFLASNMWVCVCVVACAFLFQGVAVNAVYSFTSFTRCLEAEIHFDTVATAEDRVNLRLAEVYNWYTPHRYDNKRSFPRVVVLI
jgi:hypothetical protein